jgi:predicted alpha/beta hydrolase family esterase
VCGWFYHISGFWDRLLGKIGLEDFDTVNETFVCREFDWERIRKNAGAIHLYAGDDDPYVPKEKGPELAEKLKAKLVVVPGGGHLNAEAGYLEFKLLLDDLMAVLGETSSQ